MGNGKAEGLALRDPGPVLEPATNRPGGRLPQNYMFGLLAFLAALAKFTGPPLKLPEIVAFLDFTDFSGPFGLVDFDPQLQHFLLQAFFSLLDAFNHLEKRG